MNETAPPAFADHVPVFEYKHSQTALCVSTLKSPKLCPSGPKHVGVAGPAAASCSTLTAPGQAAKLWLESLEFADVLDP